MPYNVCSKCGQEFETKNPKRIVCPNCLYLDRAAAPSLPPARPQQGGPQGNFVPGQGYGPPPRPQQPGGPPRQGGFGPPRGGGFQRGGPPRGGPGGGFRGPGRGGPPRGGGFGPPRGAPRGGPPKKLLVPKEVLFEIEKRYKLMLPLPNPDAHIKIAEELQIEANKAFFGINLIRQKMKLPKLEYPKRPLAVTPEQLNAVKAVYEMFLPMPPIGIHKILAKQLKMEEWRVHVAIGLIRKQMALPRWNEERDDLPPQMKAELEALAAKKAAEAEKEAESPAEGEEEKKPKKKPASKKKPEEETETSSEETTQEPAEA